MACPPPLAPHHRWCPRANPYIDSPSHSSHHMKIEAMNPVVPSHATTPSLLPQRHSLPPSRQPATVVSSYGQARMHQVGSLCCKHSTGGVDLRTVRCIENITLSANSYQLPVIVSMHCTVCLVNLHTWA